MMKYIGPSLSTIAKYIIQNRSEPANTLLRLSERYGSVVHVRFGDRHVFLVTSTEGVARILQKNQHNYLGFEHSHRHFQPLLGNGLLTSNGKVWRRHRRIAQHAFHSKQIKLLSTTMTKTIQKFLTRWENFTEPEKVVDIGAEMTLLTLSVVTASLFGTNIGKQAAVVTNAFPKVFHHLINRMLNPLASPTWLPTPKNREYHKALESLNGIVQGLISNNSNIESEQTNLLEMLMAARDHEGDVRLDDQELRDEVMTILIAGYETCANALTWTFYLLALHPEVQERLAEEVAHVLGNEPPTYGELPLLPYTSMVFREALRLYPPAWIMARDVVDHDTIDGVPIPAGSLVFLSPYVNHRLSLVWEDPTCFDPMRFAPEHFNRLPRFASFPFGGGRRLCLGKNFALVEASLAISLIIQRYKFSIPGAGMNTSSIPEMISPAIDMSPKTSIFLKIEGRPSIR